MQEIGLKFWKSNGVGHESNNLIYSYDSSSCYTVTGQQTGIVGHHLTMGKKWSDTYRFQWACAKVKIRSLSPLLFFWYLGTKEKLKNE